MSKNTRGRPAKEQGEKFKIVSVTLPPYLVERMKEINQSPSKLIQILLLEYFE